MTRKKEIDGGVGVSDGGSYQQYELFIINPRFR